MKQAKKKESHEAIQTKIFNKGIRAGINTVSDPEEGFRKHAVFTFFKTEKARGKFINTMADLGYGKLPLLPFKGLDYEYVVLFCHQEPLYKKSPTSLAKYVLFILMAKHSKAQWVTYEKAAKI